MKLYPWVPRAQPTDDMFALVVSAANWTRRLLFLDIQWVLIATFLATSQKESKFAIEVDLKVELLVERSQTNDERTVAPALTTFDSIPDLFSRLSSSGSAGLFSNASLSFSISAQRTSYGS